MICLWFEYASIWFSYDVRNILKLTSVYSIRIYELLKQYEGMIDESKLSHTKRKFSIDELKKVLGIEDGEYQLYGHFKNKIILWPFKHAV